MFLLRLRGEKKRVMGSCLSKTPEVPIVAEKPLVRERPRVAFVEPRRYAPPVLVDDEDDEDDKVEQLSRIHSGTYRGYLRRIVQGKAKMPPGLTIENYCQVRFKKVGRPLRVELVEVVNATTVVVENVDDHFRTYYRSVIGKGNRGGSWWPQLQERFTLRLSHPKRYDKLPSSEWKEGDETEDEAVARLLEPFIGHKFTCQPFGIDNNQLIVSDLLYDERDVLAAQVGYGGSLKKWLSKQPYQRTRPLLPYGSVETKDYDDDYMEYLR